MKWGEYSNDVQFILQWTDNNKSQIVTKPKLSLTTPAVPAAPNITVESPTKQKEFAKLPAIKYVCGKSCYIMFRVISVQW